jgi:hypothetical protein
MQGSRAFGGMTPSANANGDGFPRSLWKICIHGAGDECQCEDNAEWQVNSFSRTLRRPMEERKVYAYHDSHI